MKEIFVYEQAGVRLTGRVDPEELKLFVDGIITAPREVPYEEVLAQIVKHTPAALVHEEVVREIAKTLTKGDPVSERRVAKGTTPENGADGKVIYLARRIELKSGSVAPKYRGTPLEVENVDLGRQVARIYKPKPGVPGQTVLGNSIPAVAGKPSPVTLHESLKLISNKDSYDVLVAQAPGFLGEEQGKMGVYEELVFNGDFDHRYGSVDFIGTVVVRGDVKTDSYLCGRKGITITGGVDAGVTLKTFSGPLEIRGTVNGGASSRFVVGGELIATVLQQLDLECASDFTLAKEAHSVTMRVQGKIRAEQAQLFGIEAFASGDVWVGKFGNAAGVKSTINLCTAIETRGEFKDLLMQIESHEKAEQLLELHIGPVVKNPQRVALLQGMHRVRIEGLLKKLASLRKSKEGLIAERDRLLAGSPGAEEMAVNVAKVALPGAVVQTTGVERWATLDEKKGPFSVVFSRSKNEFAVGEYRKMPEQPKEKKEKKK